MAEFGASDIKPTPFGQKDTVESFGDGDVSENRPLFTAEGSKKAFVEGGRQIVGGVRDAAQSVLNLTEPVSRLMKSAISEEEFRPLVLPEVAEPQSTQSGLVRGISQFLTGFVPIAGQLGKAGVGASVATKLGGGRLAQVAGTFTEAEIAAQLAEQTVFDPHGQRLSDLIEQFPSLRNPVTEFLKSSPDESEAEARFKMALEGLGIGVVATPFVEVLRGFRRTKVTAEGPQERAVQAEEIIETAPPVTPPEMAGNINLSRIDSEESAKDVIRETAEVEASRMDMARRGTISELETRNLADDLGMSVEDLMKRRKGQAFNAEEALAARELLVASAEEVTRLAKLAVGGSDEALVTLEQARLRHMAIQEQVAGFTAEAGRALRQFQFLAASENKARLLKDLIAARGGRESIEEFAELASAIDTPEGMAKFVRETRKPTWKEKAVEVWINSLLSGPQTHAVNMLSNALVSMWTIPEHFLAASFGAARKGDKVFFGDAVARSYGWVEGWKDGVKALGKTLKTGEPSDFFSKIETPRERAVGGKVGEIARLPGRFLAAEDELFKAVGYRMELRSLAMRDGLEKGLEGESLAKHVVNILNDPPEEIALKAIDAARYQTFTKPLISGGIASGIQKAKLRHPFLSVIVPFVRTPTNIIRFAGERSVFAPLFKEFKDAMKKGGAERDIALARMTMGTGVSATIATLAAEGHITGGGPTNSRARAALLDTGWKPYSIKIGDEYYAYNRLEPLGMLFGIAADFSEIVGQMDEMDGSEMAAAITFSVSKNLTSKTWLSGISDLIEAIEDPERYGERYIQRLAGTVVPTGVAQFNRTQDPVLRDVQTWQDAIKSRLPGYSEELPARRNIWGEPIVLGGGLGPDIVSPIYTSTQKVDPVRDEIVNLDLRLSMPRREINGVELTPQQYAEYVELAGVPAKQTLDMVVGQPGWSDLPVSIREDIIRQIVTQNRKSARILMQARYKDELLVRPAQEKAKELQ